jgi:glycosyltransferase involved in cell wall biosynthesis
MKIVLVPSWYSSLRAPSRGSFVTEQAIALAERGHDVRVVVFDRDAPGPLLRIRRTSEYGLQHVRIAVPSPWHRVLGFYAPAILARRLSQVLAEEAPHIVHAHAVRPGGAVVRLAMADGRIPWCLTEHSGPLRAFWWTSHGHRQIDRAYQAADRLFGVSTSMVREMKHHFPNGSSKAELLYNGIDTNLFRLATTRTDSSTARLLFVGGLRRGKGIPELLQAVGGLPVDLDWRLSLVGTGPQESLFRKQARQFKVDGHLQWLGAVSREAMPTIYAEHDLLVVSSLAETFSLVAAEALACGLPVVATRCGGPEEILGPLDLPLVSPGNPAALTGAILSMLCRLPSFDRQGAAQSVEQRFSMTMLASRLEEIYSELLREPK